MEPKTSKERFFSLELKSKSSLKSVSIPNGARENVLVEGTIGELFQIGFADGIVLEIMGEKGVLRIDITEDEITQDKVKNQQEEVRQMAEIPETITLEEYKKAYRKMSVREGKIGFMSNLTAYVVVNSVLATINLLFVPQFIWFVFPLIGWGIGLTMHYAFAVCLFDRIMTEEEAKIESLARAGGK